MTNWCLDALGQRKKSQWFYHQEIRIKRISHDIRSHRIWSQKPCRVTGKNKHKVLFYSVSYKLVSQGSRTIDNNNIVITEVRICRSTQDNMEIGCKEKHKIFCVAVGTGSHLSLISLRFNP
jgi:hypothetical protein